MTVQVYDPSFKSDWDEFVSNSKNGILLFFRDFIEYHGDRFSDLSLMIRDDKKKLIALLPGHLDGNTYHSHGGLTYGGFITGNDMKQPLMVDLFDQVIGYLKDTGINELHYKATPYIYHKAPAQEDKYALFLAGAKMTRMDVLPVISSANKLKFQERRARGVKKARKNGIDVAKSDDLETYWTLLSEVLKKHGSEPVHSLKEISYLKSTFPENVKLFAAFKDGTMLAGVLVFESGNAVKSQYIASDDIQTNLGALDLLFDHLINEVYQDKPYFDFGTTTIDQGKTLIRGLSEQKEGFGARTVVQEQYSLSF